MTGEDDSQPHQLGEPPGFGFGTPHAVEDEDVAGGVAGDEHLLDLADRIPVLTPAEFLAG
jgi:hypothetical protein